MDEKGPELVTSPVCPVCRRPVADGETSRCEICRTAYHAACRSGACVVPGCVPPAARPRAGPAFGRLERAWALAVLVLLGHALCRGLPTAGAWGAFDMLVAVVFFGMCAWTAARCLAEFWRGDCRDTFGSVALLFATAAPLLGLLGHGFDLRGVDSAPLMFVIVVPSILVAAAPFVALVGLALDRSRWRAMACLGLYALFFVVFWLSLLHRADRN